MEPNDALYIHALRSIEGIGDGTLARLLLHFGSGEQAWLAQESEIDTIPKIDPRRKAALIVGRKNIDPYQLWDNLLAQDIVLRTKHDPTYPQLLKEIPDSPETLYTRGHFDWAKSVSCIAIVGSRKHSPYGLQVAKQLAEDLTEAGLTVVSGMAFGIDSVAHRGALDVNGETLAVLGSGIDNASLTPVSHFQLAQKIMAQGALLSEYPPGTPATQGSFPMRDRIIAGLCLGTIVIEAGEKSGSLITANCALDYNREVFAIPGSIFSPYSIGTNQLIKHGAKLVTGVTDILEELKIEQTSSFSASESSEKISSLSTEERIILSALSTEPLHIDKIIKISNLKAPVVSSLLALLEIKGLAKNLGGMHYVRVAS
jgi:DNA processing protein